MIRIRVRRSWNPTYRSATSLTDRLATANSVITTGASLAVKCFNVPFPGNARHIPRADLCSKICEKLLNGEAPRRVVLHGMGGIGKTELTLAVAGKQRERWHIFWIDCRSKFR
jgi:hypothetical protein